MRHRPFRSFLVIGFLAGALLVPQSAVKAQPKPGKIQVLGSYPKKPRRDGKKRFKYHLVNKGKKFRFRALGPVNMVLWTRSFGKGKGKVRLELEQNSKTRGDVKLDVVPKASRGVYLTLPKGSHTVTVIPSMRVLFRPAKVDRPPRRGEIKLDWRDEEKAAPEPSAVADARKPEPGPGETDRAAVPLPPPTEPEKKEPAPEKDKAAAETGEPPENVTVKVMPPPPPPFDPAGPTTYGQWGVFRTWTALPSNPGSVAIGLSAEYFKSSDFLDQGDEHQRLGSRLTLSGVPVKGLEINTGFSLVMDTNAGSVTEQVQMVGDPFLGVRYGYTVIDWFSLGLGVQGLFPSGKGFSQLSTEGICTRILFAFDFRPVPGLLLALNTGYHFDNSKRIFEYSLSPIQQFNAGINPHDQVLLSFGAAYQIGPVAPFLEYGTAQAVGGDSPGFGDNPSWLTIGLRAWPLVQHNWHLLAAIDIGLTGASGVPAGKARIPPYNVILAAGFDFGATQTRVEVHEIVQTIRVPVPVKSDAICEAAKVAGRIVGHVVEAETGKPLGGAKVVIDGITPILLLTEPNRGQFITCQLAQGPRKLSVYLEGYREKSQVVLITDQPDIPVKIELQPAVGETYGTIKGTVRSVTGITLPALISIPARQANIRANKATGKFEQKFLTGTFDLMISMQGYVTQRRKGNLGAGDIVIMNVELEPEAEE